MTETPKGNVVRATVVEALANAHFRITFETPPPDLVLTEEGTAIAYLAGKMRLHRIRVIVGDSVEVLLDSYGGKPRITRRL